MPVKHHLIMTSQKPYNNATDSKYSFLSLSSFVMFDYFTETNVWIAFITDSVARDVIKRSIKKCPGCKSKLGSPLLHLHEQQSLLDKLEAYFSETQGYLLKNLNQLYDQFKDYLQHSDDLNKDRECYLDAARNFLLYSTSHSIIYGMFVNAVSDQTVKQVYSRKRKAKKLTDCQLLEQLMNEITEDNA